MGVQSTLTINDGDLAADGVQIYGGQEVTLRLTAEAVGEDLDINQVTFSNVNLLVLNPDSSFETIPITVTWTLDASGDTDGDGRWDQGELRTWTASYTIPEEIQEGAIAAFGATIATKDFGPFGNGTGANGESSSATTAGMISVVDEPAPALTLEKTANVDSFEQFGDPIEYTFAVTNTGNRDLTNLTVTDPLIEEISAVLNEVTGENTGDADNDGSFDIGETWVFKGSYNADQADLEGDAIPNTATAEAFYGTQAVNDDDDEIVEYDAIELGIELTKTADQASYEGAGEEIVYTFSVDNTGNRGLSKVTVTDPLLNNVAAVTAGDTSFNIGDADEDNILDTDETWTFTGSYTTTEANNADIPNTATATGSYKELSATDTDNETVTYAPPSLSIALLKEADRTTFEAAGEAITYTFTATNNGNRDLDNLTISDSLLNDAVSGILTEGSEFNVGDTDNDGTFDVNEAWKFTGSYTTTEADAVTGNVVNVAQASATYKGSNVLSNEDDAIVNYNPPEPPSTLEGLSLGYWSEHITGRKADATWNEEAYEGASYKNASFEVFFFGGQAASLNWRNKTDVTMSEAVKLSGGGQFALARDAVAAVLNAERDDVNYKYTVADVQSMVRDAFNINDGGANTWGIESLKNELSLNNNLGNDLV
ncbi:DUF11 domain-containing protein [Cyanobium sp. A2C-AMD]|uniref:DUF11 domain-containing protein n=1 Tax=Cyanobium sp. A2C-AMD TaxID=2823695 RepID=UPI0020CFD8C3|nr:DUF11 domain-containing protein [Cyanobium sp. A2C-AMD]MCP9876790.1 DUF11 domain-containing protein [Cyanobium sp. A2C-AMD]